MGTKRDMNGTAYNLINEMAVYAADLILQGKVAENNVFLITSSNEEKLENPQFELLEDKDITNVKDNELSKAFSANKKNTSSNIIYLHEWDGFMEMAKISLKKRKLLSLTIYSTDDNKRPVCIGVHGDNAEIIFDSHKGVIASLSNT